VETFPDDSSLKITVAKWLTPAGISIADEGLSPDVEVNLTEDDYNNGHDPQLDKAIELLK
jgi:carboxyl-terminal processing protease